MKPSVKNPDIDANYDMSSISLWSLPNRSASPRLWGIDTHQQRARAILHRVFLDVIKWPSWPKKWAKPRATHRRLGLAWLTARTTRLSQRPPGTPEAQPLICSRHCVRRNDGTHYWKCVARSLVVKIALRHSLDRNPPRARPKPLPIPMDRC